MKESDAELLREAARLLHHEARLLDDGRFADWLDLFTADGIYWVPSERGQTDPLNVPSILYEDRTILAMRVRRLDHPRAHVLAPMPRTTHLVGNIEIVADATGENDITVESAFVMVEHRDEAQRVFSGRGTHRLRRTAAGWRIALKRVDLIDCDGIHGAITIPL